MKDIFKLKEKNASIKTELIAGLAIFFSMVYIFFVNANMFSDPFGTGENPLGVSFSSIFICTAICTIVPTLLLSLVAKMPFAISVGMGANALVVYTICIKNGFTYANAMVIVFFCGLFYILITLTGLRKKIFESIPGSVKKALVPGMGLFIALIGFRSSGIIVSDEEYCLKIGSFNILDGHWGSVMPLIVTLLSFILIIFLTSRGFKAAIIIGILAGMGIYYLLGFTVPGFYEELSSGMSVLSPVDSFKEFGDQSFLEFFRNGFDFSHFVSINGSGGLVLSIIVAFISVFMVDTFGSLGSLYGACERGGFVSKDGTIPNMNKMMMCDAIGTTLAGACGTTSTTTFMESAAGVLVGGRTGLTSLFATVFFAIAMMLSPVASLVPSSATAAAVIFIGVSMLTSIKGIDFKDITVAVPAFLTIVMIPFSYNVAYGIAFGMFGYVIMMCFSKRAKEISVGAWVITGLFALMLAIMN